MLYILTLFNEVETFMVNECVEEWIQEESYVSVSINEPRSSLRVIPI